MTNSETKYLIQQVESHTADLQYVSSGVGLRQSAHDNVRVSNCLDLSTCTYKVTINAMYIGTIVPASFHNTNTK